METIALDFPLYGTIIPDLRSVVYNNLAHFDRVHRSPTSLFRLDRALRGFDDVVPNDVDREILSIVYARYPLDDELLEFFDEVHTRGGSISARRPNLSALGDTCAALFRRYHDRLPAYIAVRETVHGDRDATECSPIVVSRDLDDVERAISAGNPAIHYQTVQRLKRELVLRGVLLDTELPNTQSNIREM